MRLAGSVCKIVFREFTHTRTRTHAQKTDSDRRFERVCKEGESWLTETNVLQFDGQKRGVVK
jgi:hypothetical protein